MARKSKKATKYKFPKRNVFITAAIACILVILFLVYKPSPMTSTAPSSSPSGTTSYELPGGVDSFLKYDDLDKITATGFTIYDGSNPPNLSSRVYLLDDLTLVKMSGVSAWRNIGSKLESYLYGFFNQTPQGNVEYEASNPYEMINDKNAYISGSGNCFSMFANQKSEAFRCRTNSAKILSACQTDKGLDNVQMAYYMISHEDPSSCGRGVENPGHAAVYEEADGIAEKKN